jgi:hypothetical protein
MSATVYIIAGVLGVCAIGALGTLYMNSSQNNKNPYDLTDQYGNTRSSFFGPKWDPSPQAQGYRVYGGKTSKRQRHNKKPTKRNKK